ncbi:MAG: hypothetical protein MZV64_02515 [Ignavibacteriales bacterium]|nr:hypothetical protein [Ignavibacteriales bacterium]
MSAVIHCLNHHIIVQKYPASLLVHREHFLSPVKPIISTSPALLTSSEITFAASDKIVQ